MTDKKDLLVADTALIHDIRRMIDKTRTLVASAVNAGLTKLYWEIGKRIHQENSQRRTGRIMVSRFLPTLSQQLSWSHFRELLPLEKPLQRDFSMRKCAGWNAGVVRTLR